MIGSTTPRALQVDARNVFISVGEIVSLALHHEVVAEQLVAKLVLLRWAATAVYADVKATDITLLARVYMPLRQMWQCPLSEVRRGVKIELHPL